MSQDELSFCQLKCKDIINQVDGRRLGRVTDLIFSPTKGTVLGIVAPYNPRNFFFRGQQVYIPFSCICKIGPDIILVKLTPELSHQGVCVDLHCDDKKHHDKHHDHHDDYDHNHHGHHDHHDKRGKCYCNDCYDRRHDHHDHHDCKDDHHDHHDKKSHDCDKRCEKCMLFDCDKRWKC